MYRDGVRNADAPLCQLLRKRSALGSADEEINFRKRVEQLCFVSLDGDTAKKVSAAIKEAKLKKVQAAIQGDQVRVSSPSRDDLQAAMALLRAQDFGVELKFGNYP